MLGEADLLRRAEDGLLERQLQVVAQVLAALDALPGAARPGGAEERLEDVLDRQADEVAEVDRLARATIERLVSVAVVHAALLGIREDLVGLGGFLEALGGFGRLIAIGVKLERELAIGLLDVVVGRGAPLTPRIS